MNKSIKERLTDLVIGLHSKPSYITANNVDFELEGTGVNIFLFGGYTIAIRENFYECTYSHPQGCSLGYYDLIYGAEIMEHRKEIMEIVKELDKEEVVKIDEQTGLKYYSK